MAQGTVKWFNNQKGYGFLAPDDEGRDLFVHYSDIDMRGYKVLVEGQKVEFEVAVGKNGPAASNVRPL